MLLIRYLRQIAAINLATDTTTLNAAGATKIILLKAPFTPSESMVLADVVEATFPGYAAISCVAGGPLVTQDPLTGDMIMTFRVPAGGWRWVTDGLVDPPQTIYGFAVVNSDDNFLMGAQVLPVPITLTGTPIAQEIDIGSVVTRIPPNVLQ